MNIHQTLCRATAILGMCCLSLGASVAQAAQAAVSVFTPEGELARVEQVAVTFATEMVRLGSPSLRNPFVVTCNAAGTGRWLDSRRWVYDFKIPVTIQQTCHFSTSKALRDLSGQLVQAKPVYTFHISPLAEAPVSGPADVIRLDFFTPQGEAGLVRQVQARFSEDIVRLGNGRLLNPFAVGCAIKGKGRWLDARNWVYDFVQDLPSGIACQFVPVKGLRGLSGKSLKPYAPLLFNTGGPRVEDIRPNDGNEPIDENATFLLRWSGENDRQSLPAFSWCAIEGIKEKVPVKFLSPEDTRDFVAALPTEYQQWWTSASPRIVERRALRCARQLPPGAKVKLMFGKGLRSTTGVVASADQVFSFKVRPAFTASFSCTRENARQGCAPMTDMRLSLSAVVAPELLRAIRLEGAGQTWQPQLPDDVSNEDEFVEESTTSDVFFKGPFPPEATLTLTLPANFTDDSGRPLSNAIRFPLSIKTAAYPPLAKFAANFGVIEAAAGAVPLTVRNLEPSGVVGAEARLLTLKLPENNWDWLEWMSRIQNYQSQQDCYMCGETDEQGQLKKPDPRSRSLLLGQANASVQALPRQLPAKSFEVLGLPVKTGAYIHEVESRWLGNSLMAKPAPMYVASMNIVTNLGVHWRFSGSDSVVWVTSLDKGKPIAGATVELLDCRVKKVLWQGQTDASGLVQFPTPKDVQSYPEKCPAGYAVMARLGQDRNVVLPSWDEGIQSWRFNLSGWQSTGSVLAHTIVDRSLLRAGETLHMRHVIRKTSLRSLTAPGVMPFKRVLLRHEGSGQEYEMPLVIGADGNGESTWPIPKAAKLGGYKIILETEGSSYESGSFRVEEFRLPILKADMQLPNGVQVAPSTLAVDMQLNYLNGGAFANAPITLRGEMSPSDIRIEGLDEFSFAQVYAGEEASYDQRTLLTEQSLTLDANGGLRATTSSLPSITRPQRLTLEMEYRDPSGETQTITARRELWPADVAVGIKLPSWLSTDGKAPSVIDLVTVANDGRVRAGVPVTVTAELVSQQSHRRRTVGGFYAYETVQKKTPVTLNCSGVSDAQGKLACRFTPSVSGELVITARANDNAGRSMLSQASTWISQGDRWWFAQDNNDRIDVLPEKKEYRVGDVMSLQVRMPFPEATALIGIERDGVMQTQVQTLRSSDPVIRIPVTADFAPNVYVSVFLVRGRQADVAPTALIDLGKPAFKLGIAEVKVGWDSFRLGVQVKADKARYQPREKASVSVQVTPPNGQTLAAGIEVTLAAVDEALLELAGNDSWDVLTPMMAPRAHSVETATSQLQVVGKRHYGRKALPPGGGGGQGGGTRELFDTLLYWQGRAVVDAQGRAEFQVPLNDSLTSFRLVAIASGENRFGSGQTRIESYKDISVLSGLPLLAREGDQLDPGFTLRNASTTSAIIKFSAGLQGQPALKTAELTLAPGQSTVVPVPFVVPAGVDHVDWMATAESAQGRDQMKATMRVLDPLPERVLQAQFFQYENDRSVPVEKPSEAAAGGAIAVTASASLTENLGEVKRYFVTYPYSCLEQKTSKAAGLQDRARWDEVMAILPAYLDSNGLAGFYPNTTGYPFLTAYVLRVSQAFNWPIPEPLKTQMLDGLVNYVEGRVAFDDWRFGQWDDAHRRLDVFALLAQYGRFKPSYLDTIKMDPPRWNTAMLVNWLTLLSADSTVPRRAERLAQVENLLRSRLSAQGSALLLTEGNFSWWWLYENDEATLAKLMIATMDMPSWREDQPRLLRGLLMRQQAGRWSTTIANLWGGLALKKFADQFESAPVSGYLQVALQPSSTTANTASKASSMPSAKIDWSSSHPEPLRLAWPQGPADLVLNQVGTGKPWVMVQSRARLPLREPFSAGFRVAKTVEPVQQKVAGEWHVGDVVRVRLTMNASADMGWVAIDDPVPAGSTLLGRALGRDSAIATQGDNEQSWATYAEFAADAYRAYYERVYKGEWSVSYTLRLNQSGDFRLPPTRVEAMYAPDVFGMTPNANWKVAP